ncbi:hypothetical protein BP5796_06780 [Coleophoma crateriformis]|uniref:Major facilitator superfamily (MFS) profile domain-containing protein n=1 Tax=Coleophoma crateriformis TaxID=565419 RepID=A0A3D8RPI5_9HELO|nr:hypothetical protein BP5796_06780 [Coleophoma crateriformis]
MSSPPRTTDNYDHARIEDDEHTESTPILPASVSKSYAGGQPDGKIPRELGEPPVESRTSGEASDAQRRLSFVEEDEDTLQIETPSDPALPAKEKNENVTWMTLPHKRQLLILTCARLSEPLVQTSLRSYLWYMLKSFDSSLPDSTIASQAGIMQGAFAAAQLCTAMLWGRFSDSHGRKKALLMGLTGTTISCLGFGFSTTFWQALVFRMIGGATNGNIGVMRTMISEIVREKKFQSRAFLLLPMCANAGTIIGPVLGGIMSDPAGNYPKWFGGIPWLERFPYSPPNLLSALFLGCAACAVIFGLDEVRILWFYGMYFTNAGQTHDIHGQKEDWGRSLGHRIASLFRRLRGRKPEQGYTVLDQDERRESHESADVELSPAVVVKKTKTPKRRYKNQLPFRRIFTFNHLLHLPLHPGLRPIPTRGLHAASAPGLHRRARAPRQQRGVLDGDPRHTGDHAAALPVPDHQRPARDGRSVAGVSVSLSRGVYPDAVPSAGAVDAGAAGAQDGADDLGAAHGADLRAGDSADVRDACGGDPDQQLLAASHAARTIGPALGGYVYGVGMDKGVIGATFWALAGMAVLTVLASNFVKDGDGHEIWLEGDEEPEESGPSETRG